ncbi:Oxygen regulatory protein NreC [Aquisphaera giovannonii]|uniref:Oxygen regulatory protein NreC n=1 Tax=Aquisphaera giovannonii TaxID=406548 RepID=A0A5B9VW31_9BACT|nr:response regulator transcription factor [Aquisphaera giovannonii]QEH32274.1 Oxygen regulatory protein NreC [Aquisphaera giovannonii]
MSERKAAHRGRVLIVDDHPAVREALALRIGRQSDLTVCGEADDTTEALRLLEEAKPDVAVVDISLRTGNGIDLIKRIRDRNDAVRIVVWSMHPEALYAERALRAGALGYVNKDQATDVIVEAIRRARRGEVWLSEAMAQRMLMRSVGPGGLEVARSPLDSLADRELEVLRLIGQGRRTAEIAEQLHLSVKTVETYRDRIRQKLGLPDGTRLTHYATQWVLENE